MSSADDSVKTPRPEDNPAQGNSRPAEDYSKDPGISGKKAIPALAVGCLLFAIVMGFGTYLFARFTSPFFENLEKHRAAPKR